MAAWRNGVGVAASGSEIKAEEAEIMAWRKHLKE
jgi:hypothetical protein